ncbi:hypothetical protein FB451DRAFT_135874 [Mycena latifolia]|nr:hypothetical protein FB451DRAFT_135874 [Mycena latifolia]
MDRETLLFYAAPSSRRISGGPVVLSVKNNCAVALRRSTDVRFSFHSSSPAFLRSPPQYFLWGAAESQCRHVGAAEMHARKFTPTTVRSASGPSRPHPTSTLSQTLTCQPTPPIPTATLHTLRTPESLYRCCRCGFPWIAWKTRFKICKSIGGTLPRPRKPLQRQEDSPARSNASNKRSVRASKKLRMLWPATSIVGCIMYTIQNVS